ncbi:MAG: FAD-binding oxidoreductase [Cytophagales bacterium]|nr:FAD-binding oxidoreductase [Cytophagales bacterium]
MPDALLLSLKAAYAGRLLTDAAAMQPYLLDWRKRKQGVALAVAEPDSADAVASVVRWCAANQVVVVPQGGNTGLSGGATPEPAESAVRPALVLSLKKMNRIREMDVVNNTITVDAGCILQNIQEAASQAGRLFPLSLASEGSCTLGGNLSTNAGGVNVLRYGNARELCLGLEVVTAQGQVWHGLRGLRKDNTGYDLRDVFIGAEGTLGIITAAVLKLYPLPTSRQVAWMAVASPDIALQLLGLAQAKLGAALTAFELVSEMAHGLVLQHVPSARRPLADVSPWYVLMEVVDFKDDASCSAALQAILEGAFEASLITDAAVSSNEAQYKALWALREDISEAQAAEGKNIKHDIAVPVSQIANFVRETGARLASAFPAVRMVTFGHMGDGNLHYNVSPPLDQAHDEFLKNQGAINLIVHDSVARFNGSVSAEHGLGTLRRDEAARYKSAVEMNLMRAVKQALDPQGIMNPNKLLAQD